MYDFERMLNDPYYGPQTELGTYLKQMRERKHLTQRQLAEMSGVSHGHIARLETTAMPIRMTPSLKKIAEVLDVEIDKISEYIYKNAPSIKLYGHKYPHMHELAITLFIQICGNLPEQKLQRYERRLGEFAEDKNIIASNIINYLSGELALSDKPVNGVRPLVHYIAPWGEEIENWKEE